MAARALVPVLALASVLLLGAGETRAAAPPTADAERVARGRQAFEHRCSMCHREGGTGTFVLARRLGKEKALLEGRTDLRPEYVRTAVRWGLVNMPRISRVELPDGDLEAVIAYLSIPRP